MSIVVKASVSRLKVLPKGSKVDGTVIVAEGEFVAGREVASANIAPYLDSLSFDEACAVLRTGGSLTDEQAKNMCEAVLGSAEPLSEPYEYRYAATVEAVPSFIRYMSERSTRSTRSDRKEDAYVLRA